MVLGVGDELLSQQGIAIGFGQGFASEAATLLLDVVDQGGQGRRRWLVCGGQS